MSMNHDNSESGVVLPRAEILTALARRLVDDGHVTRDRMEELEHRTRWLDEDLDALLVTEDIVPEATVLDTLSAITGFDVVSMAGTTIENAAVDLVPDRVAAHYLVMPVSVSHGALLLASAHVYDVKEQDKLRVLLGVSIRWVLCPAREIAACIKHYYGVGLEAFVGIGHRAGSPGVDLPVEHEEGGDISSFLREVLTDAVRSDASDIHFEPEENGLRLRYRIDGMLYRIPMPRGIDSYRRAVVSSLKVMAQLDITDRRLPQDGRFTATMDGKAVDVRVSVLPSRHGEAVNLRILNRETTFLGLDELGLVGGQLDVTRDLIGLQNGILLFVGPTGSGKTTSLYAAIDCLNTDDRKIITVEDPVEYQVKGITQMQVNSEIGFTFGNGLRSILRHDPDVILVGEIRDRETADIAVSAALTGHLVFSTLHTNDSASTVTRLLDMRVEPYLISSSVKGIVAQRLVRRICEACREQMALDARVRDELHRAYPHVPEEAMFFRGRGCPSCRFTGYSGRKAIFELLVMTDEIRALVVERAPSGAIMQKGVEQGLRTLRESGWALALEGVTTVDDVLRVTRYQAARSLRA